MIMRTTIAGFLLMAAAPADAQTGREPIPVPCWNCSPVCPSGQGCEDAQKTCPPTAQIDCMPPKGEETPFCRADYLAWIQDHCDTRITR